MSLLVPNILSRVITAVAMLILIRTPMTLVPSLNRVANNAEDGHYIQLLVFHGDVCYGIVRAVHSDLDFSVLTSIPYAPVLSLTMLVRSWCSRLVQPMKSMPSATLTLKR
ncbi:hypothetical protein DPMN_026247 [Dreissena polymorpha]|uniref:Uncharacterized protein n=1 Tax=Dreissena polymorpha TaxID=45954 RepID=A0A9D4RE39_DREPO|nr:hypothetical protein DPMN_026247 [Dreissena polymorpha]